MELQWNTDDTVSIEPPKRPKKLTATRLAAVLGVNRWATPFQAWCQITRAYEPPFEETKYTAAGKAIEPKQIAYMRHAYAMDNLIDPKNVWGSDPFKKTYGNFFHHPVFGGMWDALLVAEDWDGTVDGLECSTEAVLEFKTTKRAEDWAEDVPEYYALQAALYAWLLNCDDVIMVASFLDEDAGDYDRPDQFTPSADNTITYEFKVSERYGEFEAEVILPALDWWNDHVETGESPAFDKRRDADYLDAMRTASLNPESDIGALVEELKGLNREMALAKARTAATEKRISNIKSQLKAYAKEHDSGVGYQFAHNGVTCKLTVGETAKPDEDAMLADGVWDKYMKTVRSERFTVAFDKED